MPLCLNLEGWALCVFRGPQTALSLGLLGLARRLVVDSCPGGLGGQPVVEQAL